MIIRYLTCQRSILPSIFAGMKKLSSFLILIAIILIGFSVSAQTYQVFKGDTINRLDEKKARQGLWRKYFPTDTLFSEGVYVNDVPVGTFHSFHKNGKLQATLIYRGKTKVCDAEIFSPDGILIAKGKYINQIKDSLWNYFDDQGLKTAADFYVKGKKEGPAIVYYPNGKISRTVIYKADVMHGTFDEYFDSGSKKVQATMKNGEFEGQALVFHPNGNIWQKGNYENGLKNGIWIILKENGDIEKEEQYSRGKLLNPSPEGD